MRCAGETFERLFLAGNEAIATGDTEKAVESFDAALHERATGAAYKGMALARYLMTDYRASISAEEQAYAAYRKEGDRLGAARAARMLAWMNGNMLGEWAVRSGWIGRAKKLLVEGTRSRLNAAGCSC